MRQNIPRDARQRSKVRKRHFARMMQRDRRVQREKQRQYVRKTEPSPQAAAHGGAVAELHAHNIAQRLGHRTLRQHGQARVRLERAQRRCV